MLAKICNKGDKSLLFKVQLDPFQGDFNSAVTSSHLLQLRYGDKQGRLTGALSLLEVRQSSGELLIFGLYKYNLQAHELYL